jgi:hypothetical protein
MKIKNEIEKILTRINGTYEMQANDIISLFEQSLNEQEGEVAKFVFTKYTAEAIIQKIKNNLRGEK